MNLRKNRTHLTGGSNLATKTEVVRPNTTMPGQTRPSFNPSGKGKAVDEIIEFRTTRAVVTPFEKTRSFYNESGKTERPKTHIGEPRKLQLEDPDKMKMPFTGESELLFDRNLGKYRDPDSPVKRRQDPHRDLEHLAKEKHEAHASAIQETQLVGYDKYNLDTLKNNVNLEKVREAKRIIRRKYGNRKNMHSIFTAWDYDRNGAITVENLYVMAKRLGLNLNFDEARVLLATADKNGTATLGLDEFFDLIHNNEDVINVDMHKLSRNMGDNYLIQKDKLESEDDNVIKRLEEDAKRTVEIKHMNQVNMILKNKLQELATNFLKTDYISKGYTTYDLFEQNIRKLGIDHKLITNNDIKTLYEKYKSPDYTINYRNFIEGLKSFNFYLDDIYREQERLPTPGAYEKSRKIDDEHKVTPDEVPYVDFRNLPYSSVYNYLGKKRKVVRLLQKFFPTKEDLRTYLSKRLNDNTETSNLEYISQKQTKESIMGIFKTFDMNSLSARDYEGFLSHFVFNKQGLAKVDDVLTSIYEHDEDEFIKNINQRKKGVPPVGKDAFGIKDLDGVVNTDIPEVTFDGNQNQKRLNNILNVVDDRLFTNRKTALDLYKMFDVDGDGYVSRKDFINKAKQMSLIPQEDVGVLVNYLDPENKGYVNFKEFHNKIRVHANQQDEKLNPIVHAGVIPSKENHERVANTIPETQKKVKEWITAVQPDSFKVLRPTSRYGEAPAWRNTFTNMQPSWNSPMFITEKERFMRTPDARVLPTVEDNDRKRRLASAKVEVIRQRLDTIQQRIETDNARLENIEKSRLRTKLQSALAHEQGAKARNYK